MAVYFSMILVALTFFTGIIWTIDKFSLAPRRQLKLISSQNNQGVAIWMSFEFENEESAFLPKWLPTSVRFKRIGSIH
jgi:hypothetical protein